jgi:hypothetical protein
MGEWAVILVLFVALGAVVVLVAVLRNQQTQARIRLPGRAEFYIDTNRGPWHEKPTREPRGAGSRSEEQRDRLSPRPFIKPRFYLEMKLRSGPNWVYPLDGKLQVCIGRREDNDVRLNDQLADTRQAVIYWENGRYKINNLSARMPTRVNGRPITKQNVGDGNTIQMGRTKLIFRHRKNA